MTGDRPRVVITGMGALTPLGEDVPTHADAWFAGRSGITHWKRDWGDELLSRIGGDMSDFSLKAHLASHDYPERFHKPLRKMLRAAPFASKVSALASLQAWQQAGLADGPPAHRIAVVAAAHNVCMPYIADAVRTYDDEPDYIEPLFGMMALDTDVVAVISALLGVEGPAFLVGGACASGNVAAIRALDMLRAGRADAAIVCGCPIALEPVALQGWAMIEALSYRSFNDAPGAASRPFDVRREGFVPTEGTAAVVLETLESARARGAVVLAEVLGGAGASDARRVTRPDQNGQVRAMTGALNDARIRPEQVDYVNAHATSTPQGDAVEVAAIQQVLRGRRVPMNSTKSMVGHGLTAAGVIELVATVVQLQAQRLHPTINLEELDPALDIDAVPNVARDHAMTIAMSNSFGFGGINSSLVVGAAP